MIKVLSIDPNQIVELSTNWKEQHRKLKDMKLINEEGEPIKCICGSVQLQKLDEIVDMGFVSEYNICCTKCKETLAHYAYGHYFYKNTTFEKV